MSNQGEEPVQIRAFRGTRKASVYRELVVGESAFVHILATAEKHGLPLLSSLDQYGSHELDKADAQRLAEEVTQLRSSGDLAAFDGDLTALAEVARWCSHANEDAWLKIEGP